MTIGLSFLFAFGLFVALILLGGPVRDQGSLISYVKRCMKKED